MTSNKSGKEDKGITDIIKRIASIGIGGAFLNEEVIRNLIDDIPLPKDILNGLVSNAKNAKEDFAQSLREEFRKYLSTIDTNKLIDYISENYDLEVNASFSLKKKKKANRKKKTKEEV